MSHHEGRQRIAVVGFGPQGARHVGVLSSIPDVDVTVVDSSADRLADAATRFPSAREASDVEQVLDDVDAVVVATPASGHASVARVALEAGKHVLVEKPLATNVADAEMLVETAARKGVHLLAGHTYEYDAAVWRLRDLVRSGTLGQILHIDTARLSLGPYQSDVNVIWDLAPHDVSIVSYILDEFPESVEAWAHSGISDRQVDVGYLHLDFPRSGTRAYLHVSWLTPQETRQVTVVGEQRMAVYDDMSDGERIRIHDIGVDVSAIDEPAGAHAVPVTYRTGDIVAPHIPSEDPLKVQDQHFVECVRGLSTPRTPGTRGLEIVRVLAASDAALAVSSSDARRAEVLRASGAPPIAS